ncbi:hypothetical protein HNQ99_001653 [Rhizorhapis suberifaciens]|uniref:Lipoprotein n=1 Tax=Rhizorhapis suberifaciens TaxID=13656 RepID=A0A840HUY6_9SPHN|nr:hypothetical protein [Rhizorhapis suberifaciens]
MRGRWALIVFVGMAMASCGQAKERSRPSLLPALSSMAPVIACVDAAPRDAKDALTACVSEAGTPIGRVEQEAESLADFRQLVIITWLMLDRDPSRPLKPESLTKMIDYARCIEAAAYSDDAFSSRTRKGVVETRLRAELACKDHPLSIRSLDLNAVTLPPDIAERLFAKAIANLAFTYALKANGWFPNEMRPCIRYLDGRPPSAGCAGKPEPRLPPPPGWKSRDPITN